MFHLIQVARRFFASGIFLSLFLLEKLGTSKNKILSVHHSYFIYELIYHEVMSAYVTSV